MSAVRLNRCSTSARVGLEEGEPVTGLLCMCVCACAAHISKNTSSLINKRDNKSSLLKPG